MRTFSIFILSILHTFLNGVLGSQIEDINSYKGKVPFMELSYTGNQGLKTIKVRFELFFDEAPKTALNFAKILEGKTYHKQTLLSYKNSIFHRIIPNFMMQGGDFTNHNGTGGMSIYGNTFEDEEFIKSYDKGVLSMANRGKNTNGSQFFITFGETRFLDGKHLVFGKVKDEDFYLLKEIENIETDKRDKPKNNVTIVNCGFEQNQLIFYN